MNRTLCDYYEPPEERWRRQVRGLRSEAARLRRQAKECEEKAAELEALAAR